MSEIPVDDPRSGAAPDGIPEARVGDSARAAVMAESASGPSEPSPNGCPPVPSVTAALPVVAVRELDWRAVGEAANASAVRTRMRVAVERMETLLDRAGGPGLLFDIDRAHASDQAIRVSEMDEASPLWIIGDLHGDLLALEAALMQIRLHAATESRAPRVIFLGDFIDDEGFGLEVLVRIFELIVEAPAQVCVIAGNHDEALSYDGARFGSSVSPSDFADFLNANLAHEWIARVGKLALRLTAHAPRALFFPDGLLVAHGGFPLVDLHAGLEKSGNWNDPACLSDFVWARMHPKARRKMPNRFSHGSQFGYEDFADFCALSARMGRPVTHLVRGHDHVEERYAIYPAYRTHPVLTTVALSRRLNRERFGPYERAPTLARVVTWTLPQVYQLYPPSDLIHAVFPAPDVDGAGTGASADAPE